MEPERISTKAWKGEENKEIDKQETTIGDHGRRGLSTSEVEQLYEEIGYNELEHIEVSAFWIFLTQFTGLMPYILEICCVLALATEDWIDFAIIFIILFANGILGYSEQIKAKEALDELTDKMEQRVAVVRDGKAQQLLTRLLVPGDVILLVPGSAVPADVDWLEGDILSIDTSSLTGESIPRQYPSEEYGNRIYGGTTIISGEAYCIVRKTGSRTEIGSSQEAVMKDKTKAKQSVFEERVLNVVKITIAAAIIDVLVILFVQGFAADRKQFYVGETRYLIQTVLSILVASVPVALPLVLQVTMALGAHEMAKKYDAVVTSLPALQDISSMTILCSDKTGTITTARMSIYGDSVWCSEGFDRADVVFYSRLSSNPDKEDDPIDRSCVEYFNKYGTQEQKSKIYQFHPIRNTGFNSIYKRVVWVYTHQRYGEVMVAKGLPNKVIDTSDGGDDDAPDQWKVDDYERLLKEVNRICDNFSKQGYKTIGIAAKFGRSPWVFVGVLPMIDPPRHDSSRTIQRLIQAGIKVKMITGDHLNIAVETARLIGMGTNFHATKEFKNATVERDEMIYNADGFSQVLPKDKRLIVKVLQDRYKAIVGMTGDGVNDVAALSAAQCGIAVHGATDAAKNSASIILTTPGLSAIYSAIVESRRIFRKLRSYIVYRIAATIQIVICLSLIIFIADCEIHSLMIILLAMFNDLTMIPIAYDVQKPSAQPDVPSVKEILYLSFTLGMIQTIFTLLWTFVSPITGFFYSDFNIFTCTLESQAGVWVQLAVSTELLIFSTRVPAFVWNSYPPSLTLMFSVIFGTIILSVFALAIPNLGHLPVTDILLIWLYSIICLLVVDACKVAVLINRGQRFEVLKYTTIEKEEEKPLEELEKGEERKEEKEGKYKEEEVDIMEKETPIRRRRSSTSAVSNIDLEKEEDKLILVRKSSSQLKSFDKWLATYEKYRRLGHVGEGKIENEPDILRRPVSSGNLILEEEATDFIPPVDEVSEGDIEAVRSKSAPGALRQQFAPPTEEEKAKILPPSLLRKGRIVINRGYRKVSSWFDLRPRTLTASTLRPYTPGSLTLYPELQMESSEKEYPPSI